MSNLIKLLIFVVVLNVLLFNTEAASDKTSINVKSLMLKGGEIPIIVIMKEQASLNALSKENIVPLLKRYSTNSQNNIVILLNEEKKIGKVDKIKQFWIVNAIAMNATPKLIEKLSARDDVESIELDSKVHMVEDYSAQVSQGQIVNATSEIKRINATKAWEIGLDGTGINVSIIDTGINTTHPDIAGRVIKGYDFVNHDSDSADDNGHGTHVAGTVGGNGAGGMTTGVAPNVSLFGAKVLDSSGSGSSIDVIDAIQWSVENNADIISMSIGSDITWTTPNCDANDPFMAYAINNAVNSGVVVVVAAGNKPTGVSTPGCIGKAVAVGAVYSSDIITYFSGRGSAMADHGLVAPGYGINSLDYLTSGYTIKSGTSMATPHVAGAVADLMQAARNKGIFLSPTQVRSILENTSKDLGAPGKDNTYGAGRIDVFESIREYANVTINGTVLNMTSRTGIANAIVSTNTTISTVTNESGFYSLTVLPGTYNIMAKFDPIYSTNNSITVSTIGRLVVVQDIELTKKLTGTITGRITN